MREGGELSTIMIVSRYDRTSCSPFTPAAADWELQVLGATAPLDTSRPLTPRPPPSTGQHSNKAQYPSPHHCRYTTRPQLEICRRGNNLQFFPVAAAAAVSPAGRRGHRDRPLHHPHSPPIHCGVVHCAAVGSGLWSSHVQNYCINHEYLRLSYLSTFPP